VRTFPKWLISQKAHPFLLGSNDISQVSDGFYKSVLPSISWFGMDIIPTFFQKITVLSQNLDDYNDGDIKDDNVNEFLQVKITIEDSEVNVLKSNETKSTMFGSKLVEKLMRRWSFTGGNDLSCFRYMQNDEDFLELSSELSLRLDLPMSSRLMSLPPGFLSIGNRIVQNEADKRVKESLLNLVNEYSIQYSNYDDHENYGQL
jgi:hypothetical protein